MKKSILLLVILCLSLAGCGRGDSPIVSFKGTFTIGTIVEDNKQYLIPEGRQLFSSEYGESNRLFTQKQEEITIQIAAEDAPDFIAAIQSDIEDAVTNSSARIIGNGSGGVTGTSFSIQYLQEQTYGTICVCGILGEGTNFTLIVLITEG